MPCYRRSGLVLLGLPGLLGAVLIAACGQPPDSGKPESTPPPPAAQSPETQAPGPQSPDSQAPDGTAPPEATTRSPPLEDTRWHLIEVEGRPVAAVAQRAQPYIVLFGDQKQAQGFGGCNRMMGSYELAGDALKFGPLAGTKMACDYSENPEDAFMRALAATAHAHVVDNRLELSDAQGNVVARLESRGVE